MKYANYCRLCSQDFVTEATFDRHKTGDHEYLYVEGLDRNPPVTDGRRCLDRRELETMGWHRDRYGRWHSAIREQVLERVEL